MNTFKHRSREYKVFPNIHDAIDFCNLMGKDWTLGGVFKNKYSWMHFSGQFVAVKDEYPYGPISRVTSSRINDYLEHLFYPLNLFPLERHFHCLCSFYDIVIVDGLGRTNN